MWLTGFDVPELDTIYIDKPIQQHTLIQTISRVNRVCEGKDKGLIVDYIGIKKNMNNALKKYTNFERDVYKRQLMNQRQEILSSSIGKATVQQTTLVS